MVKFRTLKNYVFMDFDMVWFAQNLLYLLMRLFA